MMDARRLNVEAAEVELTALYWSPDQILGGERLFLWPSPRTVRRTADRNLAAGSRWIKELTRAWQKILADYQAAGY